MIRVESEGVAPGLELYLVEDRVVYEVLELRAGAVVVPGVELARPVTPGEWRRYLRPAGDGLFEVGWELPG